MQEWQIVGVALPTEEFPRSAISASRRQSSGVLKSIEREMSDSRVVVQHLTQVTGVDNSVLSPTICRHLLFASAVVVS